MDVVEFRKFEMLNPDSLFDLSKYAFAGVFAGCQYSWEAVTRIDAYIKERFSTDLKPQLLSDQISDKATIEGDVYIGEGTIVEPDAYIRGPAIIGRECQVRQGAYIRGNVLAGSKCIIGHATEVKNSIFLDHAQAAHFAYVGDSIIGNYVNLGAGTRLANLPVFSKRDPITGKRPSIMFSLDGENIDTGLSKLGSILGDGVQTGCNVVMSPGCIVGQGTMIYALCSVRKGYYHSNQIIKLRQEQEIVDIKL